MTTAKIFPNGRSQAVRLPKEFRFDSDEVYIAKMGNSVVLTPKENSWDAMFAAIDAIPGDFTWEREEPSIPPRDIDLEA